MSNDTTPLIPDDPDAEAERAAARDREVASSLLDPATWRIFAWVRSFVRSVLETDYENLWPGNLLKGETIWQWARYDMLDWLQPIEKLLRRILLIEAYALLETQSLPPPRPGRDAPQAGQGGPQALAMSTQTQEAPANESAARPTDDPDHPELWRVSFHVLRSDCRGSRSHVRLPTPRGDDGRVVPLRMRAVPWDAAPLARRFEAVIRICRKPQPFIRRLAFRLRAAGRRLDQAIARLCAQRPADKFARDANCEASARVLERFEIFWSSS